MENIFDILKDDNKLIQKIKECGFDILKKYNLMNEYIKKNENGLIESIEFEIKDNPLDTDYDWNGCITLFLEYGENTVSAQIQLNARTNEIDYSDYGKYVEYNNIEFNPPTFENEYNDDYGTCCVFSEFINIKNFKTIKILEHIAKSIIKLDDILQECINTQYEIDKFESKYYDYILDLDAEEKFDKLYDELDEDEKQELIDDRDGIDTYNMMVAEGWIDKD